MSNQALLVMDFQPATLAAVGGDDSPALAAGVAAVKAAREANQPVIFVRVAFRPGYPEVNSANKNLSPLPGYGDVFTETAPGAQIHQALGATAEDIVVTKRRVSAFASDLGEVLSGLDVRRLALAGITTSGVVLSTVRHAGDADYQLTVLSDACADPESDVHRMLIDRIFPSQADVVSTTEWAEALY